MGLVENLHFLNQRIREAERRFHRPANSVRLLAVSKAQNASLIRCAYESGQVAFAENYLQEAIEKQIVLKDCHIEWHFIGNIQSNKTRRIAESFDWVHSISRLSVAKRLNDQRLSTSPRLNICIEVNISNETTKTGVLPEKVLDIAMQLTQLSRLRLRGLMSIPALQNNFSDQVRLFKKLYDLQNNIIKKGIFLDTLSMGMSQDFEAAIAAGSTMIRLGTAIFGPRGL